MISIASIRLLPVLELEPGTYATESRDSPGCASAEAPEAWTQYWADCLADSGLKDLKRISPGAWFVSTSALTIAEVATILTKELHESGIPGFPDSDGEVETDLEERISALSGGFAVYDGEEPLIEPSCCGDLSNLDDWRDAARDGSSDWDALWIGHPQLRFRVIDDDVEFQETQEYNLPKDPRHFVVSARKLDSAISEAAEEQKQFEVVVREALEAIAPLHDYSRDQLDHLARLLVGIRQIEEDCLQELSGEDSEALAGLGYHRIWLDSGLLKRSQLRQQFDSFKEPDGDQNQEHYRHRALADYIDSLERLSDEGVEHLLLIAQYDADYSIKSDVPHRLIRAGLLTDEQFENVAGSFESDSFNRLVSRYRLLRGLDRDTVPVQYIQRCIAEGDRDVHEALLDRPELERNHVAQLAEAGAAKRIRNMAKQLLNSRRFRERPQ